MSTKEPQPLPELITLKKGLKLAEQWVKTMSISMDEAGEMELEARPSRLGLGAKAPRKSQSGPLSDPVERRLQNKLSLRRKKIDHTEDLVSSSKNEIDIFDEDDDDDENLDSRTNAFSKKRAIPQTTTSLPKKPKLPK